VQKPTTSQIESAYHGASKLIRNVNVIVNLFHHTSWKTSQRDVEAPETFESLGSLKVSASVSEAATSCLGLVSDKILNVLVSAQKVLCTSLPIRWLMLHSSEIGFL